MAERIPGWLERVLLPQISELKGEIKVVLARIDGLDEKLTLRVDEVDKRLSAKIDDLDKRLDVAQRLALVEEQVRELRSRG